MWEDDPASDKQLAYLSKFGYTHVGPLSKGEASKLIGEFEEDPERCRIRDASSRKASEASVEELAKGEAYQLHSDVVNADRCDLKLAKQTRIAFWTAAFSPSDEFLMPYELYEAYGQHYRKPKREQIQHILDALDAAMPTWDRDHTELFFETLKINFPELKRLKA
jgi:hypothetical protein